LNFQIRKVWEPEVMNPADLQASSISESLFSKEAIEDSSKARGR